uniref:Uncharacterized protein n=1 Tax=Ditylenchus dipsaci TaxID=166011 RepID=A0A915EEI0_9BILA
MEILKASLGDWTLIKLLIETLRKWKPTLGRLVSTTDGQYAATQQNSVNVEEKMLSNIEEEETNFGMIAVDEVERNEVSGVESDSDEDSDSTKSVIGSNQSLLRPPSCNSQKR